MSSGTGALEPAGTPRPAQDAAAAIAVAVELVTAQLNGIPLDFAGAISDSGADPVIVCEALAAQLTLLLRQVSPKLGARLLQTWGSAIALQRVGGR